MSTFNALTGRFECHTCSGIDHASYLSDGESIGE